VYLHQAIRFCSAFRKGAMMSATAYDFFVVAAHPDDAEVQSWRALK
jgi:hypothetical protein